MFRNSRLVTAATTAATRSAPTAAPTWAATTAATRSTTTGKSTTTRASACGAATTWASTTGAATKLVEKLHPLANLVRGRLAGATAAAGGTGTAGSGTGCRLYPVTQDRLQRLLDHLRVGQFKSTDFQRVLRLDIGCIELVNQFLDFPEKGFRSSNHNRVALHVHAYRHLGRLALGSATPTSTTATATATPHRLQHLHDVLVASSLLALAA